MEVEILRQGLGTCIQSNSQSLMVAKVIFTFQNIRAVARHHYGSGSLGLIKFAFYSLLRVNTFIIFECDLMQPLPQLPVDGRFKVVKPTIDELDTLRSGQSLPREFYSDKFHKVRTCYIALCGRDLAHIHWVYFSGDYSRFVRLSENVAEI